MGIDGEWKDKQNTRDTDIPIIQDWCKEKINEFLAKEKKILYIEVENWCTKQGAKVNQS